MQVTARGFDLVDRVLDDGQGLEAQKVELDQTGLFDPFHVELRRGHIGPRVLIQRHQRVQRPVPDHNPRRVGRCVAQQPLDLLAIVQQPRDDFLVLGLLAQAWFIRQCLFDADRFHALDGDHLGQPIHLPVRHLQDPPDVTHRRLGQKRPEGDDLPHLVAPVFALHILDHLFPAIHAKVDVKVGHRYPFGVQEPFKQQLIAQRVQIGNRQRIGHQTTRPRAPPRPDGNIIVFRPFDKIGNDQKVAGEPHALDDA